MRDRILPLSARALVVGALAIAAIAALALVAKTPGHRAAADQLRAPALRPVGNCDRLRSYLRRHRDAIVTVGGIGVASGATADSAAESEAAPQALGGSPTNVQEEGVDEPDIVKASGSTDLQRRRDHSARDRRQRPSARAERLREASARARRGRIDRRLRAARRRRSAARDRHQLRVRAGPGRRDRPGRRVRRGAALGDRRGRHLRPGGDARHPDDDGRGLLRERPADRLDGPPGQLELRTGHDPAARPRPRPAARRHRARPRQRRAQPPASWSAAVASRGRRASPAPGCSRC